MRWRGVLLSRLRIARNTLLPGNRRTAAGVGRLWPLLGAGLGLVLCALVWVALGGLFASLAGAGAGAAEAGAALTLVFTATLFGLLIFDLHEVVTTIVVDSDLELLRRAPIPGPSLFVLKLIDALPRTITLLLVLALPAVLAFHGFHPLPFWAWALVPLQLAALWAIPLGAGATLSIHLLCVIPARRAKETLALLSTLMLFVLWLANSFLLPRLAGSVDDPLVEIRDLLATVPETYQFSPGRWAAEAIAAATQGSFGLAITRTGWLVATAALVLALAGRTAAARLEQVHARVGAGSGAGRARSRVPVAGRFRRGRFAALIRRDARLISRDWTVLGDIVTAAILWTLLPLVGAPLYQASAVTLVRAMLLTLTIGLGYEIGARALPLERRGIAWCRLAPIHPWAWIAAKLVAAGLLSFAILGIAAASAALALRLGLAQLGATLAIVVPAAGLALAIGLWTGAVFGRDDWTHPRGMLTLPGRAISTALLIAQAAGWLLLAAFADVHPEVLSANAMLALPALLAVAGALPALLDTARRVGRA